MIWIPVILILPYLILLLNNYGSLRRLKPFPPCKDPITFVSIVIACRNEQENIPRLLNSIAAQAYPGNLFEVIVVNDNSVDDTFKTASEFKRINRLVVLNNRGTGKKAALRTGIEQASGDLMITTDADCVMGKNWLRTISAFYEQHKPDMIISAVKLEPADSLFGKLQELEYMSLQGVTAAFALSGNPVMCNGANLAFRKESYMNHSANLHDEIDSGDDVFFLHSMKKEQGSDIKWLESVHAIVTTAQSSSLSSFKRQRNRWISKGRYYTDRDTIITASVTFIAVLLQAVFFAASLFNTAFIPVFITIFFLKSIPDYLIIRNTAIRYGNPGLTKWFLPAQIIYPLYIMMVVFSSFRNPQSEIRNSS